MTFEQVMSLPAYTEDQADTPTFPIGIRFILVQERDRVRNSHHFPLEINVYKRQDSVNWKVYNVKVVKKKDSRVLI